MDKDVESHTVCANRNGDAGDDGIGFGGDTWRGGGNAVAGVQEDGVVADVESNMGVSGEGFESLKDGGVIGIEGNEWDGLEKTGFWCEADARGVSKLGDDLVEGRVGEGKLDGALELAFEPAAF